MLNETKNILVTGAAGFIGYHVSKKLLERGDSVVGVDSFNDYYDPKLKEARIKNLVGTPNFKLIRGDLANREFCESLKSEKFSFVIHLAAQAGVRYSIQNPNAYVDANLTAFGNILELARKREVRHLVYASSSSVYGNQKEVPFSETDSVDFPISFYAATKKANEVMAHTYSHLFGLPTTGLRFFTVYGPWGRPDMAYWNFTSSIVKEQPIEVFNFGKQRRDFTYIDDIVNGVVSAIEAIPDSAPRGGLVAPKYRVLNLGNNKPVELMEFISTIEEAVGKKANLIYKDKQMGDVEQTFADISAATEVLNYQPTTDIKTGVNNFIRWFYNFNLDLSHP